MARKPEGSLGEGDTIGMTGEVVLVHDDGKVTIRLQGNDYPMTVRSEHLSLIAKRGSAKRITRNDRRTTVMPSGRPFEPRTVTPTTQNLL